MNLIDNEPSFGQNADGLYICHTQQITSDFLDRLKCERTARADVGKRELHRVASVPTHVIELWLRQGVPVWNLSPREIVQRLERENLQAFITTDARV